MGVCWAGGGMNRLSVSDVIGTRALAMAGKTSCSPLSGCGREEEEAAAAAAPCCWRVDQGVCAVWLCENECVYACARVPVLDCVRGEAARAATGAAAAAAVIGA